MVTPLAQSVSQTFDFAIHAFVKIYPVGDTYHVNDQEENNKVVVLVQEEAGAVVGNGGNVYVYEVHDDGGGDNEYDGMDHTVFVVLQIIEKDEGS